MAPLLRPVLWSRKPSKQSRKPWTVRKFSIYPSWQLLMMYRAYFSPSASRAGRRPGYRVPPVTPRSISSSRQQAFTAARPVSGVSPGRRAAANSSAVFPMRERSWGAVTETP